MGDKILTRDEVGKSEELLRHALNHVPISYHAKLTELVDSHHALDKNYRRALFFTHGCPLDCERIDDGTQLLCLNIQRHHVLDFARLSIADLELVICKAKLTESGIILPNFNDDPVVKA